MISTVQKIKNHITLVYIFYYDSISLSKMISLPYPDESHIIYHNQNQNYSTTLLHLAEIPPAVLVDHHKHHA